MKKIEPYWITMSSIFGGQNEGTDFLTVESWLRQIAENSSGQNSKLNNLLD